MSLLCSLQAAQAAGRGSTVQLKPPLKRHWTRHAVRWSPRRPAHACPMHACSPEGCCQEGAVRAQVLLHPLQPRLHLIQVRPHRCRRARVGQVRPVGYKKAGPTDWAAGAALAPATPAAVPTGNRLTAQQLKLCLPCGSLLTGHLQRLRLLGQAVVKLGFPQPHLKLGLRIQQLLRQRKQQRRQEERRKGGMPRGGQKECHLEGKHKFDLAPRRQVRSALLHLPDQSTNHACPPPPPHRLQAPVQTASSAPSPGCQCCAPHTAAAAGSVEAAAGVAGRC
jgi:hypothetical protein